MRTRPVTLRFVAAAAALAALGVLWHEFAPTAFGGSVTYVHTSGISMEPKFHTGDVVVIRRQSSYHVGEIAAYKSTMLGRVVLHRIVARDGNRFVFKGDNNGWRDPEHPLQSQLIGGFAFQMPGFIADLQRLHSPLVIGLLVALGVGMLVGGGARQRRRRRREGRTVAPLEWHGLLVLGGAVVLTPLVVLSIAAHRSPATATVAKPLAYTTTGRFSYDGTATWGPAYPHGAFGTGDPIFLKLVHRLHVRFVYAFGSKLPHRLHGRASLRAVLRSSSGWQEQFVLAPPRRFVGGRVVLDGLLDLRSLPQTIARLEATTAVGGSYTLTFLPRIDATGTLGRAPLAAAFAPPLAFDLSGNELIPPTARYTVDAHRSLAASTSRPAVMSFKLGQARVTALRGWTDRLIATLICVLAALAWALERAEVRNDEVPSRYRREVVAVDRIDPTGVRQVVDVADLDTLAEIAARYDRVILHERGTGTYSVADDGVLYRFGGPVALRLAS